MALRLPGEAGVRKREMRLTRDDPVTSTDSGDRLESAVLLGRLLAERRTAAGLTQEEVAERAELSVRGLRNIELGLVAKPRRRTIAALVDALDIDESNAALLDRYARLARASAVGTTAHPEAPPRPAVAMALPVVSPRFVGRRDLRRDVARELAVSGAGRPGALLIVGPAGSGKTALAVQVADDVRESFPDGQFLLSLGSDRTATNVVARALRLLGVSGTEIPADPDEQAELYRLILATRRVLILADDATAAEARLLMPGRTASALIVTSRCSLFSLDNCRRFTVPALDESEGVQLLETVVGAERVRAESDAARRIVGFCGGLPLALRVAGGRLIAHPYRGLGWLAERLIDRRRRLDELTVDDIGVRTTLLSACAGLSRAAARLLGRLGQLDVSHVTTWIAAAALDSSHELAETLLDELVAAHLLEPTATPHRLPQRFVMHDLVLACAGELGVRNEATDDLRHSHQRVLGAALRRAEDARRMADRALTVMEPPSVPRWGNGAVPEIADVGADAWFQAEYGTLTALALQACDVVELDYAYGLSLAMADFHDVVRHGDEMLAINQRIADAAAAHDHEVARAYALFGKAELDANRGRHDDVMSVLRSIVEVFRRHRDRLPIAALTAETVMAHTMRIHGDVPGSAKLAEELAGIAETLGDARTEAAVLNCLGAGFASAGDHDRALPVFGRALALYRDVGSVTGVSLCLMRVGIEQAALGDHAAAELTLEQALTANRGGGNPRSRPVILLALAENAIATGRMDQAERYLGLCTQALDSHPHDGLSARLVFCRSRIDEHEQTYGRAAECCRWARRHAARAGAVWLGDTVEISLRPLAAGN